MGQLDTAIVPPCRTLHGRTGHAGQLVERLIHGRRRGLHPIHLAIELGAVGNLQHATTGTAAPAEAYAFGTELLGQTGHQLCRGCGEGSLR